MALAVISRTASPTPARSASSSITSVSISVESMFEADQAAAAA